MTTQSVRTLLMAALVCAASISSTAALAETRLYVPRFEFSENQDTQFLVANENDRDAVVDFWAFTAAGDLLGQFQVSVAARGTRAVTLGEALPFGNQAVTGWIGAVSAQDGIQLSYSRLGERTESFEPLAWTSREMDLNISSARETVRLSNPNPFAAKVTVYEMNAAGQFNGVRELSVEPFGQADVSSGSITRADTSRLRVVSNADLVAGLDLPMESRRMPRQRLNLEDAGFLALVIGGEQSIGAYQVTLTFDPKLIQISTKDIEGGTAEGFNSKPLVVNIDNVAGRITLGSFQVGASPSGRSIVARLKIPASVRFGIQVDEITDTSGNSLSGLPVGMVRIRD